MALPLFFASTGPTLSVRSSGSRSHGFPVPSHYNTRHIPPSSHRPSPGLQRDKLATRPHPGPSLTWCGKPEQWCRQPYSYRAQGSLWLPPNCWVWSAQGPRSGMWTASVLPCLCGPCSVRDRNTQEARLSPKPTPHMQVNWSTKTFAIFPPN